MSLQNKIRRANPIAFFALTISTCVLLFASTSLAETTDFETTDFETEIIPILTKMGCNAGSCHGSAAGRGGFKLSLYGSQPDDDYRAIVQDDKGRRINRSEYLKSLLLRKPGGELDHEGGQLFHISDPAGKLITNWIKGGVQRGGANALEEFDVGPHSVRFEKAGEKYPFNFTATFQDGSTKDVTQWTAVTSDDESSVEIYAATNVALIKRPGRHVVIARFLDRVTPIEILVPFYERRDQSPVNIKRQLNENFIDAFVLKKLAQLNIPLGKQADDLKFLRRACLDLAGRLPSPKQIQAFEDDDTPGKREKLIDQLLASDALVDYWTYRIATQLRIRSQPKDKIGAKVYHTWLKKQIAANRSWKEISSELLLATGDSHKQGPANFYRATNTARLQAEFVTESLLGVKLRCANCHNHPLDHWTQDDYHGLAAVFSKIKQVRVVSLNPSGENIHAKTGKPAKPRVPGAFFIEASSDDRIPLTEWLVNDSNPYFARSMVNRIWQSLMGRGLVEPVDDLRSTNPATHPELLQRLADDFVEHDFDLRHTIKQICMSDAYQRAVGKRGTPSFHRDFFAAARVRSLPPEVLADSIGDVTGVFEAYAGQASGTRAVELFDSKIPSQSLDLLGRCSREESCESDTQVAAGGLSAQLHLLNGELINKKISAVQGSLARLTLGKTSTQEIVEFYYVRAFSRKPTEKELDLWLKQLDVGDEKDSVARQTRLEDFVWSVLNSKEFTTNH